MSDKVQEAPPRPQGRNESNNPPRNNNYETLTKISKWVCFLSMLEGYSHLGPHQTNWTTQPLKPPPGSTAYIYCHQLCFCPSPHPYINWGYFSTDDCYTSLVHVFANLKTKNEKGISFSFFIRKFEKEKTVYTRTVFVRKHEYSTPTAGGCVVVLRD